MTPLAIGWASPMIDAPTPVIVPATPDEVSHRGIPQGLDLPLTAHAPNLERRDNQINDLRRDDTSSLMPSLRPGSLDVSHADIGADSGLMRNVPQMVQVESKIRQSSRTQTVTEGTKLGTCLQGNNQSAYHSQVGSQIPCKPFAPKESVPASFSWWGSDDSSQPITASSRTSHCWVAPRRVEKGT